MPACNYLTALRKAVATANTQISRLRKEALQVNGSAGLGRGVVELFDLMVMAQAHELSKGVEEAMVSVCVCVNECVCMLACVCACM
jgi:hypothetical protein